MAGSVAAGLAALVAGGCLGGSSRAQETEPAPAPRADASVGCGSRAEPSPPPRAREHDGAVVAALPDGTRFELLTFDDAAPSRVRLGRRRVWLWKTPASLTADRSVVVSVAHVRRARLGFSLPPPTRFARAARATRFTSCPEDEPQFSAPGAVGPRTGWGGSLYTVDRRLCLRLRVTLAAGGEPVPMRVPLGRRCRAG